MSTGARITESLDDGRTTFEQARDEPPPSQLQATDPVCGMAVDASAPGAIKVDQSGITYYFCSERCKQTFAANPEEFIAAT